MAAKRAQVIPGLILLALTPLAGAAGPAVEVRYEFHQTHMGTQFQLMLYTADPPVARRASAAAFERISGLDALLSDYDPESELSHLCDQAGGPPIPVSADLFEVLSRALDLSRRSGGAFDPTIGPVGRLWRRARRTGQRPDPDLLARAQALVGAEKVRLDPRAHTVQLTQAGMKLDLGGIAKGYASGEALKVLQRHGIPRALVAGAGDIVVGDPPPGRAGWTVGIAPVDDPEARPSRFLALSNAAISTSGDAERFVVIDGQRFSHIVDPRTGLGVVSRCSVTVVAPDGATADSLATTVFLLGPDQGLPLVEATPGAAALIVRSTPQGLQTFESHRWPDLPSATPEPTPGNHNSGPGLNPP